MRRPNRRDFLKGMSMLAAGGAASMVGSPMRAQEEDNTRFLIVLAASGGASIIDSALAIRQSESANPNTINCFPDELVQGFDGSPLRAVDLDRPSLGQIPAAVSARQSDFVRKHRDDMMVVTTHRTSVNHAIGQRRSVTGNEAWRGRTLQEMVAYSHGGDFPLPNAHLGSGAGYTSRGTDDSLPTYCFGETIVDPGLFPLSLDGIKGLPNDDLHAGLVARARLMRNNQLDPVSQFHQIFGASARLQHWRHLRGAPQKAIEERDLINKLMFLPDSDRFPLSAHGLSESPDAQRVREAFPDFGNDPFEAQAAMAFLLLKHRISVSVTLGPSFNLVLGEGVTLQGGLPPGSIKNPPIAFDFSHNGHRSVQALMWDRVYKAADGLIGLLKSEEYKDGESMWDRSLLYIATDFGRSKTRPSGADEWSTGHSLNNGVILVSPKVNGNTVLGGVDPDTGLTYGFDLRTGEPDRGRTTKENEVFAGILQAAGVDTANSGLPDVPAMRKG